MLCLNCSKTFEIITTIIKDGRITDVVAIREPKIPAVLNPANVATFTPIGPGVILMIWLSYPRVL